MVTRTLVQKKVFDICCKGAILSGHGYVERLQGIEFIKGQDWENDNKCNELLNHYTKEWEKIYKEAPYTTTHHKPELYVYWETIEIND